MVAALLLATALQAQDPVQLRARLADDAIRAGETTVLRVDVETDGERAAIQRFRTLPPGLELRGTRDYDQRQFSIPGGTRRFISREFVLAARAAGRYRIPAVDVIVAGQTYSTRSMILTVSGRMEPPGDLRGRNEDGVVLRAWVDSDTVFVGQQVTLEAEAMFSQDARLRLRRAPEYEPPSPSGFWIHDLPDSRRATTRTVAGEAYEVQRFRRALFPLSPGDYEIPPARLEYETRRGLLYSPETRELTSDPIPLTVLPVPGPRPPAFTGAVGSYTLRARLEPATVPAGEAAVLSVEVSGTGNVKALPPPALPEVPGLEAFPPSEEADTEIQGGRVRGSKRFSWVLIPRAAGELEIPAIRYAFFDPDVGGYETASVSPLRLTVTPGSGTEDGPARPTLRYLRTVPGTAEPLGWVRTPWFAAAQALPLLLLAAGLGWRRRRHAPGRAASPRALRRERRDGIRALEERTGQADPALFGDADRFARDWLAARLGVSSAEAGRPAALVQAGVGEETARSLRGLLDRLASARYAPEPPGTGERRELVRGLGRLLERVDREAPAPRRGPAGRGSGAGVGGLAVLLALAGTLAGAGSAPAQSTPDSGDGTPRAAPESSQAVAQARAEGRPRALFDAGVRAFDDERYLAAAEAFDTYLARRPDDPAAWYNLGTAYYRAGYPGYGVWAWLRVPALDPRDRDVRHNLRVAGVAPEVVARVAPPVPFRASELFLAGALLWLAAGIAGFLWLVRGRRAAGVVAVAALGLAFVLAGLGWASTRGPETRIVLETATLRAGPTLRGDPVTELDPGTALVPVETRGEWLRARTLWGDEGWVEAATTGEL